MRAGARMQEINRTIADVWTSLFDGLSIIDLGDPEVFPENPFDMFAATGVLLELSGAYHEVIASAPGGGSPGAVPITESKLNAVKRAAAAWRSAGLSSPPPRQIAQWWRRLWESRYERVQVYRDSPSDDVPAWWADAVYLFIAADEASDGLIDETNPFFELVLLAWMDDVVPRQRTEDYKVYQFQNSISSANRDVVCVMPKQQTPAVGCTMRSLSRNLALLPPRGEARVNWRFTRAFIPFVPNHSGAKDAATNLGAEAAGKLASRQPVNLLLAPWPYTVEATAFEAAGDSPASDRWRWFKLKPNWLESAKEKAAPTQRDSPTRFIAYLEGIIRAARLDVGNLHGVIFPELALDWETAELAAEYLKTERDVEFLISGLSTNRDGRSGNFVGTILFYRKNDDPFYVHAERPKHHRWKLTKSQIRDYSLGATLDPDCDWWEDISLTSRVLDVFPLRNEMIVTTLICEDLARVDPCQGVLRSIGPSLVVALLMDGPQMITRWPGRYATQLADDPGSSVLTLTSLALINRQNASGKFSECRTVALWKDEVTGEHRELTLPKDAQALCITLSPSQPHDRTLDGRVYRRTSWSLSGVTPIRSAVEAP